jgi:7-keto-8-aminopelargonate synthetase-like enzyme/acyl carrier protein
MASNVKRAGPTRPSPANGRAAVGTGSVAAPVGVSAHDVRSLVHAVVLRWLKAEARFRGETVGLDVPLAAEGLDSVGTAVVAVELEKATGVALSPDDLYRHPTIASLASYIQTRQSTTASALPARPAARPVAEATLSGTTVDPLGDSMASFASPKGRSLAERVRPYSAWQGARRQSAMWPFYRVAQSPAAPTAAIARADGIGSVCLNFASQDYLGLTRDPRVLRAAQAAVAQYGVHSAGSPVLLGTTTPMIELEQLLATTVGHEDALVFATGWAAGFGVLTGLVRSYDSLVLDARCHRCLADGAAQITRDPLLFRHNDLDHLRDVLGQARARDPHNGLFVVAESLYSMDSDSPDLAALVHLVHEFDGVVILDVAHDFGAMGSRGRGLLDLLDSSTHVDVVMGSFSKTFAATGGFVAAAREVVSYLRGHASSYVFSNAISPVQAAAALECCRIAFAGEGDRLRDRLAENVAALRSAMTTAGFAVGGTPSPIVPVIIGSSPVARLTARPLADWGLLANLVEYPAVPHDSARFRFQVMSTHTVDMAIEAASIFKRAYDHAGVQAG